MSSVDLTAIPTKPELHLMYKSQPKQLFFHFHCERFAELPRMPFNSSELKVQVVSNAAFTLWGKSYADGKACIFPRCNAHRKCEVIHIVLFNQNTDLWFRGWRAVFLRPAQLRLNTINQVFQSFKSGLNIEGFFFLITSCWHRIIWIIISGSSLLCATSTRDKFLFVIFKTFSQFVNLQTRNHF